MTCQYKSFMLSEAVTKMPLQEMESITHKKLVSNVKTDSYHPMFGIIQGILERLDAGEVIIGDGSYTVTLEKRGYVKVGYLNQIESQIL